VRDPETNTWRYVGAPPADPSVREQSGSLIRAFDVAMAAVEKGASAMDGGGGGGGGSGDAQAMTATVLGELFSIKSEVAAHFAQRANLQRCIAFATGKSPSSDGGGEGGGGGEASGKKRQEDDGGDGGRLDPGAGYLPAPAEVGLSEQTWSRQKEGLASIWCEQKWTDLVTGKLRDQAGEVSVEFGALVRKLQHRNASLLDRALKLHSDALWQLDAAAGSIVELRRVASETAAATASREDAFAAEVAATRARVDELERNEARAAEAAKRDAEEKLERTRVALCVEINDWFGASPRNFRNL